MKHVLSQHHRNTSLSIQSQQGATLFIVIMIVLIISLVASVSLKQSNLDLKVATAGQADKLLFQSSDISLSKIEAESRNTNIESADNIVGYLNLDTSYDNQLIFCLRPNENKLFSVGQFTHKIRGTAAGDGYVANKNNGYCDLTRDFISGRNASISQLSVSKVTIPKGEQEAFSNEWINSLVPSQKVDGKRDKNAITLYEVNTTSIIPAYSNAAIGTTSDTTKTTISGCMKQNPDIASDNIDKCLKDIQVPYSSHTQQYMYSMSGFNKIN